MRRKPLLLLLGFGLLLTRHLSLPAQDTKAVPVTIIVVDSAGAAIPHAQVELASRATPTPKNLETNDFGKISLDVLPGNYDLFVDAPSFVHLSKNMEVKARSDQTVVVTLQIASTTIIVQTCSPCFPIQISPSPEQPIGLLPLPQSRWIPLMQLASPTVTHTSASTRKRVPLASTTPKNPASSPPNSSRGFMTRP
jgi:hypothetical protein